MRRTSAALVSLLVTGWLLAACGGSPPRRQSSGYSATGCMGPCQPVLKLGAPPTGAKGRQRVPDVSEWQPCVTGGVPTVIRLYESGTARQDSHAACNASALHRTHVWFGGYTFLRPGNCVAEAAATVGVVQRLGGLNGPVIADAEVPLPAGFVRCFLAEVHRLLRHYPTATYTGCYSGLEIVGPWWVPDYGVSSPCTRSGHVYAAWQYTDGSFCGERFVTDCSLDFGILKLRPVSERQRILRADIAGRQAQRQAASIAEHQDWLLVRFWRSRRPQTTALRRDWERREADRQHELAEIATDNRLIALWRAQL